MTYFTEIHWEQHRGGLVSRVEQGSLGSQSGIRSGDELLAINQNKVDDIIDVRYYSSEESLELLVRREQEYLIYEVDREYGQTLGLEFEHPTFDTDIHRCNNLCEFCFVLQMAPRFRRTLYIKDDDYRYSFLYGHFVTLTNLNDHDWWRIENMALSPLYVSVHVTDLDMRRKFLRNKNAPDIMQQLAWLAERGIDVHTQLVVVPGFNDGSWLQQSIEDLAGLWPSVTSISVVPVGLTRFHKYGMRTHTRDEARQMIATIGDIQADFQEHLGLNFVYLTDEWYLVGERSIPPQEAYDGQRLQENGLGGVRDFLEEWKSLSRKIGDQTRAGNGRPAAVKFDSQLSVTLVTGTLFSRTLMEAAAELATIMGINIEVHPVVNQTLGETITVAGLLMASDIVDSLKKSNHGSLVFLPRRAFDHPDQVSLDDLTPGEVSERLNTPVALAETMADVWETIKALG